MSAPQVTHDTAVGAAAAAAGVTGLTLQTAVGYGNLAVLALNGILAIGGLVFLILRLLAFVEDRRYTREQRERD